MERDRRQRSKMTASRDFGATTRLFGIILIALLTTQSGCSFLFGRRSPSGTNSRRTEDPGAAVRNEYRQQTGLRQDLLKALYHLTEMQEGRDRYFDYRGSKLRNVLRGIDKVATLPEYVAAF